MSMHDPAEAQRLSAQRNAAHKAEIEAIAERNRQAHLAAKKRREAAQKMSARLRRGLGGD